MRAQFGDAYASSVAKDHVLAALGERTVDQALADGVDAKTVWRAVCQEFDVPRPALRARRAARRAGVAVRGRALAPADGPERIFSGDAACWHHGRTVVRLR